MKTRRRKKERSVAAVDSLKQSVYSPLHATVASNSNIVSKFRKIKSGKADARVAAWIESAETADSFISVITVQQLEIGVCLIKKRDSMQIAALRQWLNKQGGACICGAHTGRNHSYRPSQRLLYVPNPAPVRDALIATTALVHGLIVVTRNVADFAAMGVETVHPQEG